MKMKRKIGLFSLILVLIFALTGAAAAPGPGAGEAAEEEILAQAEAGIEALETTAAVKERLRTMARTWLRDGEKAGLGGERLRELMQAMVQLCGACDPARERTRLRSACRLMIRKMQEGGSAERICAMLCERLRAGENLAQAIKALNQEMNATKNEGTAAGQGGAQGGNGAGGAGNSGGGAQGGSGNGGTGGGPGGPGGKA